MRIMLMYAILPALPLLFFMLIPAISRSGEPIQLFPGINAPWTSVNDSVMGGRSKGGAEIAETGLLRFVGDISLENRGGFSSIRSNSQDYGLPGNGTIVLRLRGANRGYFMDLRTSNRQGGFSYRAPFRPQSDTEWAEIRIPLSTFRASAFGMDLPQSPPLRPDAVQSIGFTLYDTEAGPFTLEIERISFEADEPPALPDFKDVEDPPSAIDP